MILTMISVNRALRSDRLIRATKGYPRQNLSLWWLVSTVNFKRKGGIDTSEALSGVLEKGDLVVEE